MLYRYYAIQYTKNAKDQFRWIVEESDEVGLEGFATQLEAFDYVDKLMKDAGKENEATDRVEIARRNAREWEAGRSERGFDRPKKRRRAST